MVATADEMATGGSMAKTMTFSTMPSAAEAITPIWLTMTVMMRNDVLTNTSCKAMGVPSSSILRERKRSSRMSFRVKAKRKPLRHKNHKAAAKLSPCDTTVAMAAPAARMCSPPTKRKSSTMLMMQARPTR